MPQRGPGSQGRAQRRRRRRRNATVDNNTAPHGRSSGQRRGRCGRRSRHGREHRKGAKAAVDVSAEAGGEVGAASFEALDGVFVLRHQRRGLGRVHASVHAA